MNDSNLPQLECVWIWLNLIKILLTFADPDGLQISSSLPALTGWPTRSSRSKSLGSVGCEAGRFGGTPATARPTAFRPEPQKLRGQERLNEDIIDIFIPLNIHWIPLWTMVKCAQMLRKCTIGRQTPTGALSRSSRVNLKDLMKFKHHLWKVLVPGWADLVNYTT